MRKKIVLALALAVPTGCNKPDSSKATICMDAYYKSEADSANKSLDEAISINHTLYLENRKLKAQHKKDANIVSLQTDLIEKLVIVQELQNTDPGTALTVEPSYEDRRMIAANEGTE